MPSRNEPTRALRELLIKRMFLGDYAPNKRVEDESAPHQQLGDSRLALGIFGFGLRCIQLAIGQHTAELKANPL